MNETIRNIKGRRSTRRFKSEQIKDTELHAIIDAGLHAPSAHNGQTWHFTVVQNEALILEMNTVTKQSAKFHPDKMIQKMANNESLNLFYGAPTLVIVSGKTEGMMSQVDCAAATQNMLIAAESMDVGSCWNGLIAFLFNGPKKADYIEKLEIPQGYTPYYAAAFGYKETKSTGVPKRKENTVHYIK